MMNIKLVNIFLWARLTFLCCLISAFLQPLVSKAATTAQDRPIILAVVDDAFDRGNPLFKGMLWRNTKEIPNNGKDDDGNGKIDDAFGWDASDHNSDIAAPTARLKEFAHGDRMASVIARSIRDNLGEMEDYPIKLMFVKAISDTEELLNMKDGYLGLQYAIDNNADIVNLSWSGGLFNNDAKQTLAQAYAQDTFVLTSMGTYPQRDPSYPAAHAGALGVAGIDADGVLLSSNYGSEADLAAPATVAGLGASETTIGVSNSVAFVSAAVALMKHQSREANNLQIKSCLLSTATSVDEQNPEIAGQMGAGALNLKAALSCVESTSANQTALLPNPKGILLHSPGTKLKRKTREWLIKPKGKYAGISLRPYVEGKAKKARLEIVSAEPAGSKPELIWGGLLSDLPEEINTRHQAIKVSLFARSKSDFKFVSHYSTKNINFSEVFCKGTTVIGADAIGEGISIVDGSGDLNYMGNSDCKWHLKPKDGFDIRLDFTELDTQLGVDSITLFRGDSAKQTDLLMRVTGNQLPPRILVEQSDVLLWFLSDKYDNHGGFKVKVSMVPSGMTPTQ